MQHANEDSGMLLSIMPTSASLFVKMNAVQGKSQLDYIHRIIIKVKIGEESNGILHTHTHTHA